MSRGTMEEKLRWTFSLYDINGDGFITREEMTDIATAVYELMGRSPETSGPDPDQIRDKVERVFTVRPYQNENVFRLLSNYAEKAFEQTTKRKKGFFSVVMDISSL